MQFPVFLLPERRKTGKSTLLPMRAVVKMQPASFPPLRAEENWKIKFTADESGGKAAPASSPPLRAEENWKIQFNAHGSGGKAA
ncbi:hypothetical protein AAC387_Pa12g1488 [Persea americana]